LLIQLSDATTACRFAPSAWRMTVPVRESPI
jgi:hypothetical protein